MSQITICDECGREVARKDAVRKLRPYGIPAGTNLLLYSSYDSSFWSCGATDRGEISMGLYKDRFRARPVEGSATSEERGAQTWRGTGTIRTTTATDASGLTNVCFSQHIGAYHSQAEKIFSAVLGCCDSAGNNKVAISTWTIRGAQQAWWSRTQAELTALGLTSSALYFYTTVTMETATSDWWVDLSCVQDAESPGSFQPYTSGTAVDYAGPVYTEYKIPVLCPECAPEPILKPSEAVAQDPRVSEWVEIREEDVEL